LSGFNLKEKYLLKPFYSQIVWLFVHQFKQSSFKYVNSANQSWNPFSRTLQLHLQLLLIISKHYFSVIQINLLVYGSGCGWSELLMIALDSKDMENQLILRCYLTGLLWRKDRWGKFNKMKSNRCLLSKNNPKKKRKKKKSNNKNLPNKK
jgi:hypothetical protein